MIWQWGALETARRIRDGDVSPVQVVEAHIGRIGEVNPLLNALVADRFDAALLEARAAERAVMNGEELGPLHGVPFTAKELLAAEGMPATFGSVPRRRRIHHADGTAVARLRAAGAILLGVTNVPEWGFWFETDNLVYGRTNNPWDLSRTPGGSSGGEGALLAAGGTALGLGSDIGGSIRMPAAFCGVFGHKPTHGLVPLTGHYPVYAQGPDAALEKTAPFVVVGPMARNVADLTAALRIIAGPDGVDPNAEPIMFGDPSQIQWRGRRVFVLDDPRILLARRAAPDVRAAVQRAAAALQACGAIVEEFPAALFRDAIRLWFASLRTTSRASLAEAMDPDAPVSWWREWARAAAGRRRISLTGLLFLTGEAIGAVGTPRPSKLAERARALAREVETRIGDGVLLMPVHPVAAPRHGEPLRHPFDYGYTAILNVLRVPVTVAPVGFDARGLPLAVQIVAPRGADDRTLAAASVLENALWSAIFPLTASETALRRVG